MGQIRILTDELINKIAAGQVVERPASVVKELVENSLDAGATDISVEVEEGGCRLIRVQDNGCGMNADDALLAFERHATSKVKELCDLDKIATLGFRGEALPSIASVSKVRIVTSDGNPSSGSEILIEGGKIQDVRVAGRGRGTTLEVRGLFYNTAVRRKFLKSRETELSHITGIMTETALAHPGVYFTLKHHDRTLIKSPGVSSVLERSVQLLGKDARGNLMELEEGREGLRLFGLISIPGFTKPSGTGLSFFVNRRPVSDRTLRHAVYAAYETLLMKGRHPLVYLFLDVDPALVDVNVHPAKREVRFTDPKRIHDFTRDSVRKTAQGYGRAQEDERPSPWPASERVERVKEAVESYLRTAGEHRFHEERTTGRPAFTGRIQPEPGKPAPAVRALFDKERLVPLGQIADSFIITQDRDGLILIDQHAAHERILYEKFKQVYRLSKIPVQQLLIPVNLELSGKERILLAEHLKTLRRLGIEVEDFGRGTFSVKGVPMWVADMDIQEIVRSLLEEIVALEQGGELDRRMEDIIHVFSCRAAVKANRRLSREEMEALIRDLGETDSPHTCEHGRPTMIRIDLYEIEKRFQRK